MWYVKAEWHGIPNCWWGAYKDKGTADDVAKKVNGSVFTNNSCETCLHDHNDGDGCAIHHEMKPCNDWHERMN